MNWRLLALAVCAALTFGGCSGDTASDGGGKPPIEPLYPDVHVEPSWAGGLIAFRDVGYVGSSVGEAPLLDTSKRGVWLVPVDGLTDSLRHVYPGGESPALSYDAARLAYVRNRRVRVTEQGALDVDRDVDEGITPKWSHDGTQLAYCKSSDGIAKFQAWVYDTASGEVRRVAGDGERGWYLIEWAPQDNGLLFMKIGYRHIFYYCFEDSSVTQITDDDLDKWDLSCNSAGEILFAGTDRLTGMDIYMTDMAGARPVRITDEGGRQPEWNDAGTEFVYVKYDSAEPGPRFGVLWKFNMLNHTETQLTHKTVE